MAKMQEIIEDPDRLELIVKDIIKNYSDIENVKNFRQVHEMKSDYELLSEEEVEKFVKEIIEDEERKYKK